MRNPKLMFAVILAALATIVFFQNRELLELRVLPFTVTLRRTAALGLAFPAGTVVGFLAFGRWSTRKAANA